MKFQFFAIFTLRVADMFILCRCTYVPNLVKIGYCGCKNPREATLATLRVTTHKATLRVADVFILFRCTYVPNLVKIGYYECKNLREAAIASHTYYVKLLFENKKDIVLENFSKKCTVWEFKGNIQTPEF